MTDRPAEPTTLIERLELWSGGMWMGGDVADMALKEIASLTAAKEAAEKQCEELDGKLTQAIQIADKAIHEAKRAWTFLDEARHALAATSPKEGT